MVRPSSDHAVPAFMLLVITMPMTSSACMLSRCGLDRKFVNRKHSKLQQTSVTVSVTIRHKEDVHTHTVDL